MKDREYRPYRPSIGWSITWVFYDRTMVGIELEQCEAARSYEESITAERIEAALEVCDIERCCPPWNEEAPRG